MKLQTIIRPSLLLALSLFSQVPIQAAPENTRLKIATVDMQQLFKQYHRTTAEQQKFSEVFARIQKENNELIPTRTTRRKELPLWTVA